jgi:hypothetical protein
VLSVILYGRNDAHGYNLQKRAALSLNSIAELLSDSDDEIIFVDYNTPDESPTFPEAIEDTLTGKAIGRLRVLRVRPAFHQRYARQTRLAALEPQSRNIAIRRANPDNRWVLSTNTDMIFVPHDPGDSLTAILGRLQDGGYHLPRFEVPESLWDRLDRMDPDLAMRSMRQWGRRFHLNEIVYGGYDNLYDAPGDFQLFLRSDLFAVGGFEERMILGWHVDANLARRMTLLRGEIKSAAHVLFGYHCGHLRQATSLHGRDRTENSPETFVAQIRDPVCRHQLDSWGAPDSEIEEIRLGPGQNGRFLAALSAAVPRDGPVSSEAAPYRPRFAAAFTAEHVLPHLCSLVYELPAGQRILYLGDNFELLAGLRKFLAEAHGAARLVVPSEIELGIGADPAFERQELYSALEQADAFIIQYPSADLLPGDLRKTWEWRCLSVLERIVAAERARPPATRRRVIAVNAVQTPLQVPLVRAVAVSSGIFTTRVCHGFVLDPPDDPLLMPVADPAWRAVYMSLGRRRAFDADEHALLRAVLDARTEGVPGWPRLALEIAAVLAEAEIARREYGLGAGERERLARAAAAILDDARRRVVAPPVALPPRPEMPTRLCSGNDWESPQWEAQAARCFPDENLYPLPRRTRWHWERISPFINLLAHVDPGPRPWVLVVADEPDRLPTLLGREGYRVAYATTDEVLASVSPTADWGSTLEVGGVIPAAEVYPLSRVHRGVRHRFAAIFALLPESGAARLHGLVERLGLLAAPGAHLEASLIVSVDAKEHAGALSFAAWQHLFDSEGVLGRFGLEPVGATDLRIPLDTVLRFAPGDAAAPVPGLSFDYGGGIATSAVIAARWPLAGSAAQAGELVLDGEQGRSEPKHSWLEEFPEVARRLLTTGQPFARILPGVEQNLLPLLCASAAVERTLTRVTVTAPDDGSDGVWLALFIDARRLASMRMSLHGPDIDAASVRRAIFRSEGGTITSGNHRYGGDSPELLFAASEPLGRGVVLLSLWSRSVELCKLNVAGV